MTLPRDPWRDWAGERGAGGRRTPQSPEVIEGFFLALQRPSQTLTSWELGFLASAKDQFDRNGRISERQFEVLERLYVSKTD